MRAWRGLPSCSVAVAVAAAGLLASSGCNDFPDVTTVVDLRVLAVATEPSEIILDTSDDTSSLPIDVTALLPDPVPGHDPVTWTMIACPNFSYGAAPPAAGGGGAMLGGGARTTVGSNLCREGLPSWPIVVDPVPGGVTTRIPAFTREQILAALMSDLYVDQFGNPHGGYDLGLPMNLQLTATDGVQTVVAIKRVLFWVTGPDVYWKAPLDPEQAPNVSPTIGEVRAYRERDPDTAAPVPPVLTLPGPPFAADTRQTLGPGEELWMEPVSPPGTVEPYWTSVIDAATHLAVPLRIEEERIRYAFYATAGKFEPARTASELPIGFTGTVHLESKYTAPRSLEGLPLDEQGRPLVTVWITARDERGGESWIERQIAIVAP